MNNEYVTRIMLHAFFACLGIGMGCLMLYVMGVVVPAWANRRIKRAEIDKLLEEYGKAAVRGDTRTELECHYELIRIGYFE